MKGFPFHLSKPASVTSVGSPRLGELATLFGITYFASAVLVGLADIFYILRHYTKFPFGDHWIWLAVFYQKGLLGTLCSQFNEHRLAVPGLLYFLDHRYFGGTNTFLIIASILIQIGCIVFLIVPVWRQSSIAKPMRYAFSGFVVITMLWFIQAVNFIYPFSLCLSCSNLGILVALHLFSRVVDQENLQARLPIGLMLGVITCGFWATFSYGHGILIWPVLLVAGLAVRLRPCSLSILLAAFIGVLGIYFFHYKTPVIHAGPLESLVQRPVLVAHYIVLMMGLPFFGPGTPDVTVLRHVGSYVFTLAGLLTAGVLLLRFVFIKGARSSREEVIYCSLMLLAIGAAFITALGRSQFPLSQALSDRYAPVPLLFWISLAALVTADLSRWEQQGGMGRAIWCAVIIMASISTLSTQLPMGQYVATRERGQAAAAISLTVGVADARRVGEELTRLDRVSLVDRRATSYLGHSLFYRPEAQLLGTPLLDHFQVAPAGACLGFVDTVNLIPKSSPPGTRLYGWAWNVRQRRDPSRIWVVDDKLMIRGLGITHVRRPDVAAAYRDGAMDCTGWIAYSRLSAEGSGPLAVFADLGDEKSVCQIGAPHTPAP